uniref:Dipeptidase n=1 Tax=Timema monikensis TaxID=170555 RepID=A0A7R9EE52_9NEOP|nr:unnamed protein product [Timema monikensis]
MIHVQGCVMCHPQFWSAYIPCSTQHLDAVQLALEQIDVIRRLVDKYPTHMTLVTTAQGIEEAHAAGLLASLIGVEGGHAIGTSLGVLRMLYQLGARYLTLTHTCNTPWADCSIADEPGHIPHLGGLSRFGTVSYGTHWRSAQEVDLSPTFLEKGTLEIRVNYPISLFQTYHGRTIVVSVPQLVVREMNRLGMIVDLSHVSVPTMLDALRISRAPVIFSHSSAHALCNSSRNVPDHVLRAQQCQIGHVSHRLELSCRETGQMRPAQRVDTGQPLNVQTTDLEDAVQQAPPASTRNIARTTNVPKSAVHQVLRDEGHPCHYAASAASLSIFSVGRVSAHINHIREVAGVDHVGIGAGYDGINITPLGLEDVSRYPYLLAELLGTGRWTQSDLHKLIGRNLIRVFHEVQQVRDTLQAAGEEPIDEQIPVEDVYGKTYCSTTGTSSVSQDSILLGQHHFTAEHDRDIISVLGVRAAGDNTTSQLSTTGTSSCLKTPYCWGQHHFTAEHDRDIISVLGVRAAGDNTTSQLNMTGTPPSYVFTNDIL